MSNPPSSPAGDMPIRDAATLILVRDPKDAPKVLLGRRHHNAVFMPDRFVFPGGAVDPADSEVPLAGRLRALCQSRLKGTGRPPHAFAAAAIRELFEETGLVYATPGAFAAPPGWAGFTQHGLQPTATGLALVFRAITPPGRTRRFDARFFLADAAGLWGNADNFNGASGELTDLAWVPLDDLQGRNIAPVTQAALEVVMGLLPGLDPPEEVVVRGTPPR